jgi:hypothetical protein
MIEASKEFVSRSATAIGAMVLAPRSNNRPIAGPNKKTDELCYKTKTKQYIIGISTQAEACVFTKRQSATSDALASL